MDEKLQLGGIHRATSIVNDPNRQSECALGLKMR